jgi:hypothetical protein
MFCSVTISDVMKIELASLILCSIFWYILVLTVSGRRHNNVDKSISQVTNQKARMRPPNHCLPQTCACICPKSMACWWPPVPWAVCLIREWWKNKILRACVSRNWILVQFFPGVGVSLVICISHVSYSLLVAGTMTAAALPIISLPMFIAYVIDNSLNLLWSYFC